MSHSLMSTHPQSWFQILDSHDLFVIADRPQVSALTDTLCLGAGSPEPALAIHDGGEHLQSPLPQRHFPPALRTPQVDFQTYCQD